MAAAIAVVKPDVIVPCDERAIGHLHELYARVTTTGKLETSVAKIIERSLGSPNSYPLVSARYELLKIAREEGVRIPEMSLLSSREAVARWRERRSFPCAIKADGTFAGQGVRIAHTPEQADRNLLELTSLFGTKQFVSQLVVNGDPFPLWQWLSNSKPKVMVQSYVEGRPANCAVVCWQGKVLAGIAVDALSTVGPTGPATVVRVVESTEMMSAAERIANRLGLSGFFGLDFIIEEDSGAHYLIEMNPRCTPVCHLQLGKGRDMIGALWAQLSGVPELETLPVTKNRTIAYFPSAWTCKSELLETSYQDIPRDEPDLVAVLLGPPPARSALLRAASWMLEECGKIKRSVRGRRHRDPRDNRDPSL